MNRQETIQMLEQAAPVLTQVTFTNDLGYEFSAVVPGGVIYAMPGMLLSYSGGEWPPSLWKPESEEEDDQLWQDFLLDDAWEVTPWEALSDEQIETLLEDVLLRYSSGEDEEDQQDIESTAATANVRDQHIFKLQFDTEFDEYAGTDDFPEDLEKRIRNSIKSELIFERCIIHQGAVYWIWCGQREPEALECWPVYFRLISKDALGVFQCYGYHAPHSTNISISAIINHINGAEIPWGGHLHKID